MPSFPRSALASLLLALVLTACGGGGDDGDDPAPPLETDPDPGVGEVGVPLAPDVEITPPAEAPVVVPGARLVVRTNACPTVGDAFELSVALLPPASEEASAPPVDVSASVALTQSLGEGLEVLSQGDGAIGLRMNARDIVALRADLPDASTGRTVYVGGFAPDAPDALLMRKPVAGGCLYALRLPERGFCGTAISRGAGSASLGTGDIVLDIEGCEYEGPDGLELLELPATP